MRDTEFSSYCNELFMNAKSNATNELWNGKFFRNFYDTTTKNMSEISHIGQLAGEFFANLFGIGELYDKEKVQDAIKNMIFLHCNDKMLFPANNVTLDGKPVSREGVGWFPHIKIFLTGISAQQGLVSEGINLLERVYNTILTINDPNWWDHRLYYDPITGKERWGRFYMTAPSSWLLYQVLAGYHLDVNLHILSLEPKFLDKSGCLSVPVFTPVLWGWLEWNKSGFEFRILKTFKKTLVIKELILPQKFYESILEIDGTQVNCVVSEVSSTHISVSCKIELNSVRHIRCKLRN